MEKKLFLEKMTYLAAIYGHDLKKERIVLYWGLMKDWSEDAFCRSCEWLVSNWRPTGAASFPVPADFMEGAGGSDNAQVSAIVQVVQKAIEKHGAYADVSFEDPALHATIERFGGWPEICTWTYDDWNFRTRDFKQTYESARKRGSEGSKVLRGISSLANNKRGIEGPARRVERLTSSSLLPHRGGEIHDEVGNLLNGPDGGEEYKIDGEYGEE